MDDLLRLRLAYVAGEVTRPEAAASLGITPALISQRWRDAGLIARHPMPRRYHPLRHEIRAAFERNPAATDVQVCADLVAKGHKIAECTVRNVRRRLGIGPVWSRCGPTDEELREARRRVEAREVSARVVAQSLGYSVYQLYKGWHRLDLIKERPRGATVKQRKPKPAPVRDEVAVYLRDYAWMNARQIADAMTADGQPVSAAAVRTHRRKLRLMAAADS